MNLNGLANSYELGEEFMIYVSSKRHKVTSKATS